MTGAVPDAWGGDVVAEVDAIEVDGEHENHLTGVVGVVMGGEIGGYGGDGLGSVAEGVVGLWIVGIDPLGEHVAVGSHGVAIAAAPMQEAVFVGDTF